MDNQAVENTDRELWRERPGDYYSNSIHVTKEGLIGMDVGGTVVVLPVTAWHSMAKVAMGLTPKIVSRDFPEEEVKAENTPLVDQATTAFQDEMRRS